MKLHAGELRHLVTIEENTGELDAAGQREANWTEVIRRRAEISPAGGRELVTAGHVTSEVTHAIRMRYTPAVNAAMRVNFNGRIFEIAAIENVEERNTDLVLHCIERS